MNEENTNNTVTKADIAAMISAGFNLPKNQATDIVNVVIETITKGLEEGKTIDLYRCCKLQPVWVEQSNKMNPKTKEPVDVPAHWTVKAKISQTLKDAVKNLPIPT